MFLLELLKNSFKIYCANTSTFKTFLVPKDNILCAGTIKGYRKRMQIDKCILITSTWLKIKYRKVL